MKEQPKTTTTMSFSIPTSLSTEIDKAWHRYTRSFINAKVSRSRFVAELIRKGLEVSE